MSTIYSITLERDYLSLCVGVHYDWNTRRLTICPFPMIKIYWEPQEREHD